MISLELFKQRRTEIISKMLDNPNLLGIYPTSNCYMELDELYSCSIKQEAIKFAAEYAYRKANPDSKMDIPSIVYENVENFYKNNYNK